MSLRRALMALPDDAATRAVAVGVVGFLDLHPNEVVPTDRIERATGLDHDRVAPVISAFADALVVDCDDPAGRGYVYHPDPVLELEVRRFLRSGAADARLHKGIDRYRGRFGSSM